MRIFLPWLGLPDWLADKPFIERVGKLRGRGLLPKKPAPKPNKSN